MVKKNKRLCGVCSTELTPDNSYTSPKWFKRSWCNACYRAYQKKRKLIVKWGVSKYDYSGKFVAIVDGVLAVSVVSLLVVLFYSILK